jgi:hypothetical protein
VIDTLEETGFITAGDTDRDERYPERTTYHLATEIEGVEIPRVALVETEDLRAVTEAELRWVTAILQAPQDGSLSWNAPSPTA